MNLTIEDKEFVVLVGPSGCGKSTLLRMIAGLEDISSGELYIGENLVNKIGAAERDIAMVFQSYALFPHMTAYENMAFGLENRKFPKAEIKAKISEVAKILDMEDLLTRKPKAMSGGQRQRVALGRAMVRNPAVFLLDEPLSNLDAKLRTSMRSEIVKLHQRLQTTFIYVTHDQIEAMTMGSKIVVMKDGVIQQVGSPKEIYQNPQNIFVAGFIGTPQMNFIEDEKNQDVTLGIRPEHITISQEGAHQGKITFIENIGSECYVSISWEGKTLVAKVPFSDDLVVNHAVCFNISQSNVYYFDTTTGERI